ncbi:MAG: hypothetical protein ABEJ43_11215 [Haloferacaceae archaeon]
MERRSLLVAVGSAVAGGLAGYVLGASGLQDGPQEQTIEAATTETPAAATTETATATPTPTPTETPTPTTTPTPTSTATPYPTHEFGESFVVSGASTEFRYVVHSAFRSETVGRFDGVPAEGVYVGVVLTVENRTSARTAVPLRSIVLRGGVREYPSAEASNAAGEDDRIGEPSLANATLYPDEPVRGVVVYDFDPERAGTLSLHVVPPDVDGPVPHVLPLGPLSAIEPLG